MVCCCNCFSLVVLKKYEFFSFDLRMQQYPNTWEQSLIIPINWEMLSVSSGKKQERPFSVHIQSLPKSQLLHEEGYWTSFKQGLRVSTLSDSAIAATATFCQASYMSVIHALIRNNMFGSWGNFCRITAKCHSLGIGKHWKCGGQ